MTERASNDSPERLQQMRDELCNWGARQISAALADRIDLSGVIQQTLLDAYHSDREFLSRHDEDLWTWLQTIFDHNLIDEIRRCQAQKRDVRRERRLVEFSDEPGLALLDQLADQVPSPSKRMHQRERKQLLLAALDELTEDQRQAIELHFLQHVPVDAVAVVLDRSVVAVASLIARGMKRLRQKLEWVED
jgi:RNA polymerase sigma-70 factor (ECF subfamily)